MYCDQADCDTAAQQALELLHRRSRARKVSEPPSREKWIADNSFDQVSPRRKVCIKSPFDIVAIRGPRFRGRYLSRRINGRTDITYITWSVAAAARASRKD